MMESHRRGETSPMKDRVEIYCPYCGEVLELLVEEDLRGQLVQDCEVCCNPIQLDIRRDEWGDPQVGVERTD
jgi:hypothetical protein